MNNAKWRKLFIAWAKSSIKIEYSEWFFIDSEGKQVHPLPIEANLMEKRFSDGQFQPFEYKWIRSIFIPKRFRPIVNVGFEIIQDTEGLKEVAQKIGSFPIFDAKDGIEIRGYEK